MSSLGLYVHIPFCARKCPYCDFYSVAYHRQTAADYTAAVCAGMRSHAGEQLPADTLYFGGGTPSLLPPEMIGSVISAAGEAFHLETDAEITLEANPNTVSPERLAFYRDAGINRVSYGMQSAEPTELAALGRAHTAAQVERAVELTVAAGIRNISLDVMLGTPGQTADSVRRTLEFAVSLPVSHISAYMLKVEPATPYWENPILEQCMDEDALAGLYLDTVAFLETEGFAQYEISNFAKPGMESRHNRKYWRCEEYLGFGAAAHSFFQGRRYGNARELSAYIAAPEGNAILTDGAAGGLDERVLLGLRLTEGIPADCLEILPRKNREQFLRKAEELAGAGYVKLGAGRVSLTPRGFLVSNAVLAELLQYIPERQ